MHVQSRALPLARMPHPLGQTLAPHVFYFFSHLLMLYALCVGNSTWHSSRMAVVSLLVCVAGIIIVAFGFEVRSGPQANLLYALYACGIVLTLLNAWSGVAGTFTAKRDELYIAYVKALFNGSLLRMHATEKLNFLQSLTRRNNNEAVHADPNQGVMVPASKTLCAVCGKVPPVTACLTCADVMCADCWHHVHQGRLAVHERSDSLANPAQPSSVQQVMSQHEMDAAFRKHLLSYKRALQRSVASWRAQFIWLWRRTSTESNASLLRANPDVSAVLVLPLGLFKRIALSYWSERTWDASVAVTISCGLTSGATVLVRQYHFIPTIMHQHIYICM